jgi:NAD(P)-dependent dehydrogenase (short-subunit alcohol dehydrogenase family)
MVKEAAALGQIYSLINNAGIGGFLDIFDENAVKNFDRVIGLNLRGTFICTKVNECPFLLNS